MSRIALFPAAVGVLLALHATTAVAIVPGQVDDFQNGTLQSWQAGGQVNPNGPVNVSAGGPDGPGDRYLRLTSNGSFGPGGKLVVFNNAQWSGNYLAADLSAIQMQVNNFGSTDLVLRLILANLAQFQSLTTMAPINVPANSGWSSVSFSLDPANLSGGVFNTVMSNVGELNLVHSPNVIGHRNSAPNIVAQLGVDNITAVPATLPVPTWNVDADGNWSLPANWTGGVPNAAGAEAVFGDVIAAPRTVTVDVPVSIGRLNLDSPNSYTIAGTNALALDATTANAQIEVARGNHTITAPVTLADNTVVTVEPADGNLSILGGLSAAALSLTKAGGGTLAVNQFQAGGLTINAGKLQLTSDGANASLITSLAIAGGATPTATLDVASAAAVVDYTGGSPATTIRQQILSGRGGSGFSATWTGMGIASSAAAAANAAEPQSRSIGYAENSALPLGAYTDFRGQSVDNTSILLAFTRTGDANLDGVVNDDDVTIVGAFYAPGVSNPHWTMGDFDYNGFVDDDDVTLLGVFYNPSATPLVGPPAEPRANGVAAVPEPATLLLLALAAGIAAIRRLARCAVNHC